MYLTLPLLHLSTGNNSVFSICVTSLYIKATKSFFIFGQVFFQMFVCPLIVFKKLLDIQMLVIFYVVKPIQIFLCDPFQ